MKHEQPNQFETQAQSAKALVTGAEQQGRTIQSVDRALTVLETIAEARDGMTVSSISEMVGLNVSTCHHLVTTLVHRGYLTQLSRTRGYALGPRLGELVELSESETDPAVLLEKDLRDLGARLGHGVQFAVLSETSLLTKLSFPGGEGSVAEPSEIEKMTALHATATGKAILAWIPDTELVRVISANGLTSYTPRSITSLSGLVEELRLVRRRKYAVDDEELRDGVVCIGTTIREGAGAVIGSISVTVSAERATEEYRQHLIKEMITAANTFSNKLRTLKT
ncbi:IclR family transcriptional regulator [Phaeobacter piscinae]|uniref:IclR family transcriptional regulator n=2 Tax=Phaeobacter TaxID=302485 RepID=UPI001F52214D|nr:IclR family transcriptional regulator [Phaeobacter piscinae]